MFDSSVLWVIGICCLIAGQRIAQLEQQRQSGLAKEATKQLWRYGVLWQPAGHGWFSKEWTTDEGRVPAKAALQ